MGAYGPASWDGGVEGDEFSLGLVPVGAWALIGVGGLGAQKRGPGCIIQGDGSHQAGKVSRMLLGAGPRAREGEGGQGWGKGQPVPPPLGGPG